MSDPLEKLNNELWALLEPMSWVDAMAVLGNAGADAETIRWYHEKWEQRMLYGNPDPDGKVPVGIFGA